MSDPTGWNAWGPVAPQPAPGGGGRRLPPVTFWGILEITARLARRHAAVVLVLAAFLLLPAWLLNAAAGLQLVLVVLEVMPDFLLVPDYAFTPEQSRRITEAGLVVLGTSWVAGLASAVAGIAFSDVVERDYQGQRPSIRLAGARALRRLPAVLGMIVLSTLAFIGLLLGGLMIAVLLAMIGGVDLGGGGLGVFLALVAIVAFVAAAIVLWIRWSLANVVVALEEAGPLRALIRSWRLTAGAAWRTLGMLLIVSLVAAIIARLLSEILGLASADLIFGPSTLGALVARTIIGTIIAVVFAPLLPIALTVLYFDQRVRREGFDLVGESQAP